MYRVRESDSDSDSSDGETSWKRAPRQDTEERAGPAHSEGEPPKPAGGVRRKNRVWGDVVQEETLTGDMTAGFGVQAIPRDCREDRGVESYDYTRARFDPRPRVEPLETDVPQQLLKYRERRAVERRTRTKRPDPIEKKDEDTAPTDNVVKEICERLKEPKSDLIGRAVSEIGNKMALELLHASETIEANGGLMINNGTRRRTPGGVFLHLLRNDKRVDKEMVDRIFEADLQLRKIAAKKRKRSAIEKKAANVIRALEAQLFGDETHSQTSEEEDEVDEGMEQVPAKRPAPANDPKARTSDLEDGEIDD